MYNEAKKDSDSDSNGVNSSVNRFIIQICKLCKLSDISAAPPQKLRTFNFNLVCGNFLNLFDFTLFDCCFQPTDIISNHTSTLKAGHVSALSEDLMEESHFIHVCLYYQS